MLLLIKEIDKLLYDAPRICATISLDLKSRQTPRNKLTLTLPKVPTNETLIICKTCPYIANNTEAYRYTFHNTSHKGKIQNTYTCSTNNLIYVIQCKGCSKFKQPTDCLYIEQTGRTLRERFGEHRRDISNN